MKVRVPIMKQKTQFHLTVCPTTNSDAIFLNFFIGKIHIKVLLCLICPKCKHKGSEVCRILKSTFANTQRSKHVSQTEAPRNTASLLYQAMFSWCK